MGNKHLTSAKRTKNDEFYTQYADIQREIEAYLEYMKSSPPKCDATYIIPIVFHVFGTEFNEGTTVTDEIVKDALMRTNEDFQGLSQDYDSICALFEPVKQPIDIEFALAKIDPDGNPILVDQHV